MKRFCVFVLALAWSGLAGWVQADLILGGNAIVQFDANQLANLNPGLGIGLTPVWYYDASNGAATATGAQISAPFAGGGAAVAPAALYNFNHQINIGPVTNPSGRARQTTNADLDPNSPLTTWSSLEQIGVDGVTVFTVTPVGGLLVGDYSLTYSSALNRLSLFNNFQIGVEAFRVNNPTFTTTGSGFTIQGELLTGAFFPLNNVDEDLDVGFFTLNAITAVPEPSSMALLGLAVAGLGAKRMFRRARSKK